MAVGVLVTLMLTPGLLLAPSPMRGLRSPQQMRRCLNPLAALDYNNPDVAAEFSACQALDTEQVHNSSCIYAQHNISTC